MKRVDFESARLKGYQQKIACWKKRPWHKGFQGSGPEHLFHVKSEFAASSARHTFQVSEKCNKSRPSHFFSSKRAKEEAKLEAIHKTDPHRRSFCCCSLMAGSFSVWVCVCDECGVEMRAQGLCYYNALRLQQQVTHSRCLPGWLTHYLLLPNTIAANNL